MCTAFSSYLPESPSPDGAQHLKVVESNVCRGRAAQLGNRLAVPLPHSFDAFSSSSVSIYSSYLGVRSLQGSVVGGLQLRAIPCLLCCSCWRPCLVVEKPENEQKTIPLKKICSSLGVTQWSRYLYPDDEDPILVFMTSKEIWERRYDFPPFSLSGLEAACANIISQDVSLDILFGVMLFRRRRSDIPSSSNSP